MFKLCTELYKDKTEMWPWCISPQYQIVRNTIAPKWAAYSRSSRTDRIPWPLQCRGHSCAQKRVIWWQVTDPDYVRPNPLGQQNDWQQRM